MRRDMKNLKVLFTGGAGSIGSHIAERLLGEGYEVVVVYNLSTGYKRNLSNLKGFQMSTTSKSVISQKVFWSIFGSLHYWVRYIKMLKY